MNRALDAKGLTHFDARDASERNAAVATTLGVSLAQLDDAQRERLQELAVFAEDVPVPLDLVAALWKRTGAMDEIDAEALCEWLARLSLLLSLDLTTRVIQLHDVVRQFLLVRLGSREPALHAELLNTGRPGSGAWCELAADAGYWWSWLFTHLRAADRHDELRCTATDLRYLVHKAQARSALAVEPDLAMACAQFPDDAVLAQLRRSYTQATGLLAACGSAADAMTTLLARLVFVPCFESVVVGAAAQSGPRLMCVEPPPDMPHPALIRTLGEHRGAMSACVLSADGRRLAAADSDRLVLLWDAVSGNQLLVIKDLMPRALAISSDGCVLAVATNDRRLVLLEVATGRELWRGKGHVDAILAVALNLEHNLAVTASADHTLQVWDVTKATARHTLGRTWDERDGGWLAPANDQGHWGPVLGCALSADGRLLASASADQTAIVLGRRRRAGAACAERPPGRRERVRLQPRCAAARHRIGRSHADGLGPGRRLPAAARRPRRRGEGAGLVGRRRDADLGFCRRQLAPLACGQQSRVAGLHRAYRLGGRLRCGQRCRLGGLGVDRRHGARVGHHARGKHVNRANGIESVRDGLCRGAAPAAPVHHAGRPVA